MALWIVKNARCGIAGAGENSNGIGAICPTHLEKEERELYKATFMLVHAEYGVGGLHLTLTIPGHKRNRKVYQTKSGYWYCNLTSEKGCPERQVLNLEGYQSKEDILRHMKSLRTDYCILRCSMEGFTV